MRKIASKKYTVFGIICLVTLGLSSCKTTRVVTTRTSAVPPISSGKLIRNIENNTFDYKYLSIKRISCQFDNGKVSASFKASIQAEKDKRIVVLLSKLNIPVGRLWLTPDSVKYINYLENNYFLDDYSYLSSVMGMDLSFETVNAIISNNVLALRDEKLDKDNDFDVKIDSGLYVLESMAKLNKRKLNQKNSMKKPARKSSKVITDAPVHQSVYVDPETFKLRKIRMEDVANSRNLKISFSDYTNVGKQLYPGEIFLQFISPDSNLEMRVRLANFSTEEENEIRFKVPDKFERINSN